jgi:hypothetical protein
VVESGTGQCPLPEKYRDLGDEEQGEMEWLKPDEFVARYKESTYFSEVEKTIEQIRSEAQASQPAAKAEVPSHTRAIHSRARAGLTKTYACGNTREWTLAI